MTGVEVVCLLPARNCERDLDGYFESAARFADAVVALDDGSTDATAERLSSEPLVRALLRNPARPDYRGWNDGLNRNRLVTEAARLNPEWVVSLDADERLAADDASALRRFIEDEARPGHAYSFRVFRMIEDLHHYDLDRPWVCRLFAFEPGQRFPDSRLHFAVVPTSIPRERWIKTTIRIQHLSGLTESRRRSRFEKYVQADPERVWQQSYDHLLARPGRLKQWEERCPDLPLQQNGRVAGGYVPSDPKTCPLSLVVVLESGEPALDATLRLLRNRRHPYRLEVIVVAPSGSDARSSLKGVEHAVDGVRVVEAPAGEVGGARDAGLRAATGRFVWFPRSAGELTPESVGARVHAHEDGYAMVTGAVRNGTPTWVGWASYFLEHSLALPGVPAREVTASGAEYSYLRDALLRCSGWPVEAEEGDLGLVNLRLLDRGYGAYRTPEVTVVHHSPCTTVSDLVRHHFLRGCSLGRGLPDEDPARLGFILPRTESRNLITYVPGRLARMTLAVYRGGGGVRTRYVIALPLVAAAIVAQWSGLCSRALGIRPRTRLCMQARRRGMGKRQ
jgi:Glycosyl transferase family 2